MARRQVAGSAASQHRPRGGRATGVFVIDSKNWSGTVELKDGVLRQHGYSREKEVVGAAEAGIAVLGMVPDVPVHPVLCLVREVSFTGWVREVMLSSTGNLDGMMQTRPHVLSPEQARLEAGLSQEDRARPPSRRTPSARSRVSSRRSSMVGPLVVLLFCS